MSNRTDFRAAVHACLMAAAFTAPADALAELVVSKTVETSFVRSYLWDIEKTADKSSLTLSIGQTASVQYEVGVTKIGFVDSDWAVSGVISINNPDSNPYTIVSVNDIFSDGTLATVDCGDFNFGSSLATDATLLCTYSALLSDGANRLNSAVVTFDGAQQTSFTANVVFADPTTPVNNEVTIDDTIAGHLGNLSGNVGDSVLFTYSWQFGAGLGIGEYSFTNIATIAETGQSDSFTVRVAVVPEPATVALVGVGLVGLVAAGRRRKYQIGR